jgi:hypothetical protein
MIVVFKRGRSPFEDRMGAAPWAGRAPDGGGCISLPLFDMVDNNYQI